MNFRLMGYAVTVTVFNSHVAYHRIIRIFPCVL